MTTYVFRSDTARRYQVLKRGDHLRVDGTEVPVRALDNSHFVAQAGTRPVHVRVVAHGDTVYLQLNGRACAIERVDPTRSGGGGGGAGQGSAAAPMPGVVVSWIAQPGAQVAAGEALLVIESMKLQMTIEAPQRGTLEDLPFQPGQTFQRGAVLARVRPEETPT
ncbi:MULTISPECIES: acetyl-CoA carboxylase biotin carboxyl carrier protein subunit [Hydrogenophaga]|uniref:Acetyl-CoA carboxylase biotin carboxyl carrier protein subunit n=2 Tax=Hydrogenophaga TaxID=47420 RepID=A0ABW2QN39_9BURK